MAQTAQMSPASVSPSCLETMTNSTPLDTNVKTRLAWCQQNCSKRLTSVTPCHKFLSNIANRCGTLMLLSLVYANNLSRDWLSITSAKFCLRCTGSGSSYCCCNLLRECTLSRMAQTLVTYHDGGSVLWIKQLHIWKPSNDMLRLSSPAVSVMLRKKVKWKIKAFDSSTAWGKSIAPSITFY